MGEAQEVEGLRLALSPCRPVGRGMPAEFNQAGFLRVQFQGKLRHSGAYRLQEPLGIGPVLKTNDRIVGVAHHDHGAARMAFAPLLGPEIVDVVEIDVRQQRRYDRPLRGAFRRRPSHTVLHHTRFQPLADKAQHALVADPVLDEPHHPLVADVVEEPADVSVQYPVHRSVLNANHKRVQRVVLAPSGPKPVGEADEAQERKAERFTALLHHIDASLLEQAYNWLKRDAAPGVDGMTWDAYGEICLASP